MNIDRFRQFVNNTQWVFAKSMPSMPHYYTLLKDNDPRLFREAVIFIRNNGHIRKFQGRTYTYFDIDGYTYWTMGSPIEQTILINRATL